MTVVQRLQKQETWLQVIRRRKKLLVSEAVHPEYIDVVKMYAKGQNIECSNGSN